MRNWICENVLETSIGFIRRVYLLGPVYIYRLSPAISLLTGGSCKLEGPHVGSATSFRASVLQSTSLPQPHGYYFKESQGVLRLHC